MGSFAFQILGRAPLTVVPTPIERVTADQLYQVSFGEGKRDDFALGVLRDGKSELRRRYTTSEIKALWRLPLLNTIFASDGGYVLNPTHIQAFEFIEAHRRARITLQFVSE